MKEKIKENYNRNKSGNGRKIKFWAIDITKECTQLSGAEKEYDKLMNYSFGYGESIADK